MIVLLTPALGLAAPDESRLKWFRYGLPPEADRPPADPTPPLPPVAKARPIP